MKAGQDAYEWIRNSCRSAYIKANPKDLSHSWQLPLALPAPERQQAALILHIQQLGSTAKHPGLPAQDRHQAALYLIVM